MRRWEFRNYISFRFDARMEAEIRKAAIEEEGGLNLNVNVLRKTRGWIFWPKGHDPLVYVDITRAVRPFLDGGSTGDNVP